MLNHFLIISLVLTSFFTYNGFDSIMDQNATPKMETIERAGYVGITSTDAFQDLINKGEYPFNKLKKETIQNFAESLVFDKNNKLENADPSYIQEELSVK